MAFDEAVFREDRLDPAGWQGLRDAEFRTGGGTEYADVFAKAGRRDPSMVIILTDLDAALPPAPSFPVLWAVPRAVDPPGFGHVLVIGEG